MVLNPGQFKKGHTINKKHGMSGTDQYRSWHSMKHSGAPFPKKWHSFEGFWADVAPLWRKAVKRHKKGTKLGFHRNGKRWSLRTIEVRSYDRHKVRARPVEKEVKPGVWKGYISAAEGARQAKDKKVTNRSIWNALNYGTRADGSFWRYAKNNYEKHKRKKERGKANRRKM